MCRSDSIRDAVRTDLVDPAARLTPSLPPTSGFAIASYGLFASSPSPLPADSRRSRRRRRAISGSVPPPGARRLPGGLGRNRSRGEHLTRRSLRSLGKYDPGMVHRFAVVDVGRALSVPHHYRKLPGVIRSRPRRPILSRTTAVLSVGFTQWADSRRIPRRQAPAPVRVSRTSSMRTNR